FNAPVLLPVCTQDLRLFGPSRKKNSVLWPLLTSHSKLYSVFRMAYSTSVRPPRVRAITFPSSICHIYMMRFGQYWTLRCVARSSASPCLICDFCSSDRGFASGFLQIPPRDGHPCLWLTVPTAKPVADFHRLVIAHAGRTTSQEDAGLRRPASSYRNKGLLPSIVTPRPASALGCSGSAPAGSRARAVRPQA